MLAATITMTHPTNDIPSAWQRGARLGRGLQGGWGVCVVQVTAPTEPPIEDGRQNTRK